MPPSQTGIAHYSSMLVPSLRRHVDLTVVDSPGRRTPAAGHSIYHLGNNPHHEWIYRAAMESPGVVVLHDVVLHHLIVEMTLARGDADAYAAALRANHGEVGEAWARGRAAGLHSEMGNFLLPASIELAQRSRGVIVHNNWAANVLRSYGVTTPINVVPHPSPGPHRQPSPDARVAGVFGFLTSAKRGEVILEAMQRVSGVELLVVGEAAPNIDASLFRTTGYVSDEDFESYFARVDRVINLRYPSAGETSGTLLRAFAAGKPVAVSDYAQFAEYPDDCVVKIPLGEGEVDALADFLTRDFDRDRIATAQAQWLQAHATLEQTVQGYVASVKGWLQPPDPPDGWLKPALHTLPLFVSLAVIAREGETITLKNTGDVTLRTRSYDQPGYRVIAKLFADEREIESRWIEVPRDLAPGEETSITVPARSGATSLKLYHAIQGVPMLEPEPWYAAAL